MVRPRHFVLGSRPLTSTRTRERRWYRERADSFAARVRWSVLPLLKNSLASLGSLRSAAALRSAMERIFSLVGTGRGAPPDMVGWEEVGRALRVRY